MRISQTTGVHIVKDGNRKRARLGSSECSSYWRQNYEAWLARARPRARDAWCRNMVKKAQTSELASMEECQ